MTQPHGSLSRYKCGPDEQDRPGKGCHCARCQAANRAWKAKRARMVAYGQWEPRKDPAGTRRRLGALLWDGWSMGQLGAWAGWDRCEIRRVLLTRQWILPQTAERVQALHDELWDQRPPEDTPHERQAATKARRYARDHGYLPFGAWDENPGPHWIDDPAATPAPGWEPSPVGAAILAARKRKGMTQAQVAAVLGVSRPYFQNLESGARTPGEECWQQLELTLGPLGVVRDRSEAPEDRQRGEESDAA